MQPVAGQRLAGRYEVLREIGRGGMGIVYLGHDPVLDREVALKLIAAELIEASVRERFMREARVIARMDHPSIVPVYDLGEQDGALFLVMPFVAGDTLRKLIEEGRLTLGDVLDLGIQAARALEYSHELGIVHRDVKPENVLVERQGDKLRARLTDFGLAVVAGEQRITRTGALVGTVSYFSPEQIAAADIDARTDVYALGTVLYECLTGRTPFSGELQAVLYRIAHEPPRPLRALSTDLDAELEAIVMACLGKDPSRRTQRAGDLAEALERYRASVAGSARAIATLSTMELDAHRASLPLTPLVGRERELSELCLRLDAAQAGESQLCLVAGEHGIGKSRLLEELERIARSRHLLVVRSQLAEQGSALPYQAYCDVIEQYCRTAPSHKSRPVADLSDLRRDLVRLFPVLAEVPLLSGDESSGSLHPPAHDQDRTWLFELLARTLLRIAGAGPLLVVLEDLHAGNVSVDALHYIVRRLSAAPVLFACSYVPSDVDRAHPLSALLESFRGSRRCLHFELGRLSPEDHHALLASLVPGSRVSDSLADKLYELTEGSPYFAVELVRSLLDAGTVVRSVEGAWTVSLDTPLGYAALPQTIHKAVEARLDRLDEPLREVLATASVLGPSFDYRDLEELVEDADALDDSIDRLVDRGFLKEERQARGDRLAFTSGVLREVLYGTLSRRKRRRMHRRAAETLERRHRGRLERVRAELVQHYAEADEGHKVCELGLELARSALGAFAADEAIVAARRVLSFVDDAGEAAARVECDAHLLLAAAFRAKGELESALRELERARKIAASSGERERELDALVRGAETAWEGRRFGETKRWLEPALEAARAAAHPRLEPLLMLAATVANLQGDGAAARALVDEAERLAQARKRSGDTLPVGEMLTVAVSRPVRAIDPAATRMDVENEVSACVYETLVTTDKHGHLMPWLCERWDVLDDGRRFVFVLRSSVRRHDGRALTAFDVKAAFERTIRLRSDSPPAAFAQLVGVAELLGGAAGEVRGIVARDERRLHLVLTEPLLIYPSFLTDQATAVACEASDPQRAWRLVGTGPFVLDELTEERVLLERSPSYWADGPAVEGIEFLLRIAPGDAVRRFRAGSVDVVRDLAAADVEEVLGDRNLRASLADVPRKAVWFALFNDHSVYGRDPVVRRALFGVVPTQALAQRHVGPLAQPGTGLLPAGVLGHDAGRKRERLTVDEARALIASAKLRGNLPLRIAVSPALLARHRAYVEAIVALWGELGLRVHIMTSDERDYAARWDDESGIDMMLGGWVADYDDPDAFVHGLFHAGAGRLRRYHASPALDALMEQARREPVSERRAAFYRRIDDALVGGAHFMPLFGESDVRLVSPRVQGLTLRANPPYVNYAQLRKASPPSSRRQHGGLLVVPISEHVAMLDPAHIDTVVQWELISLCMETLTREEQGARVVPWLASSFMPEDGGRRWRIRLRDGVRFHDGRKLGARDIRASWERTLRRAPTDRFCAPLMTIAGAAELREGKSRDLRGLDIVSASELTVELTGPLAIFPALLSEPATGIVPEGTGELGKSFAEGFVGTGPFRLRALDPRVRLELEPNPLYWRAGLPRSDGITFQLGVPPDRAAADLRAGRCSLAPGLLPADVEAFRQRPEEAVVLELPSLSTNLAVFNIHAGAFRDQALRRLLAAVLPIESLVRESLGTQVLPAHTLLPPELLGHELDAGRPPDPGRTLPAGIEITCELSPSFESVYAPFTKVFLETLTRYGFVVKRVRWLEVDRKSVDLLLVGFMADYPDPDSMAYRALHTVEGSYGMLCGLRVIDALVERARLEPSRATRASVYQQVEQLVAERSLLLPLFHPFRQWVARGELRGLRREGGGLTRGIDYAELWAEG